MASFFIWSETSMRRNWTKKEEKYMIMRYTKQPVDVTAKKLNRSKQSVIRKANRLGLNSYVDNLGARAIAKCFGVDVAVVIRWINKLGLPSRTISCRNQVRYDIDINDFW